jgi:hypothetical protein
MSSILSIIPRPMSGYNWSHCSALDGKWVSGELVQHRALPIEAFVRVLKQEVSALKLKRIARYATESFLQFPDEIFF